MKRLRLSVIALSLLAASISASTSAAQSGRADAPVARLRGTVYDSVARAPLAQAAVRVFRSDSVSEGFDTRSDSLGGFTVPPLRAGTWLLSFLHPRLDSLRVEAPLARIDVVEAGDISVTLAVPSGATLARARCGRTRDDSTAVIVGDVRDAATRRPVPHATVRATWPEWVFARKQMGREDMARVARADSTGHFVLCGVPQATTVTALAYVDADTTGTVELLVPASDYVVADFVLDRQATLAMVASDSSNAPAVAWKRGAGTVRGRVQTPDGKPFANAIARVLGSGSVVRSDSSGVFRITDAAAGTQTVEVRAVGFEPQRHLVQLTPNEPYALTVAIDRSRVMLDTVRVVAGRPLPPDVQRIETRWRRGLGTFLDGNTVRERSTNFLTSALWGIPGVRLGMRAGFGNTIYLRAGGGGECIPVIYLDGFRFIASGISIDEMVAPDDVAAIEMYVRAMQRPAEFTDLSDCGVFVVWTKRFLGNVPVLDPRRKR
ncbi:carboxypeptidase-like regulatory domain-containing protein [Gemmatimonas sp.]